MTKRQHKTRLKIIATYHIKKDMQKNLPKCSSLIEYEFLTLKTVSNSMNWAAETIKKSIYDFAEAASKWAEELNNDKSGSEK